MGRNKQKRLIMSALVSLCISSSIAQTPVDSVDTYQHQIVSSTVSIQGRHVLTSSDVTVTSTGDLKLSAPDGVEITGPFTVQLGGILQVNGGRQWLIRYTYDNSGNRIRREKNPSE